MRKNLLFFFLFFLGGGGGGKFGNCSNLLKIKLTKFSNIQSLADGRESARRSVELNPFALRDGKVVATSLRFAYHTANISELQLHGILKYFFFYKQEWNKNRIFTTTHPIRINEDEG